MSNLIMWNLIVGFALPLVVAAVQQPKWSSRARALVTFTSSVLVGGGTAFFTGDFTGKDVVASILITLVTAISTYKGLWQPTAVAPVIESKTSGLSPNSEAGAVDAVTGLVVVILVIVLLFVVLRLFG